MISFHMIIVNHICLPPFLKIYEWGTWMEYDAHAWHSSHDTMLHPVLFGAVLSDSHGLSYSCKGKEWPSASWHRCALAPNSLKGGSKEQLLGIYLEHSENIMAYYKFITLLHRKSTANPRLTHYWEHFELACIMHYRLTKQSPAKAVIKVKILLLPRVV